MRTIVVYPGRFHPFHRGHKASYDHLVRQFGEGNVYVVSSDSQDPEKSPFSFDDKLVMMTKLGIPPSRIARVKNPYQAREITQEIDDKDNTVLIFAVSEKDMAPVSAENPKGPRFAFNKKDGSPGYLQPLPADAKKLKPMSQQAYVAITPTVNFQVRGADANSASQIRKQYIKGNDSDREQIIADLYGEMDPAIKDIFDRKLGVSPVQTINESVKDTLLAVFADLLRQLRLIKPEQFDEWKRANAENIKQEMIRLLRQHPQRERIAPMVHKMTARLNDAENALQFARALRLMSEFFNRAVQLKEFAPTGIYKPPVIPTTPKKDPFGDDPRSSTVRRIQQLLDAGKSVFVLVPGARGRAVGTQIGDDYSYLNVRFRDFLTPKSRTRSILTLPLKADNDEDLILSPGPGDKFIQTTGEPFDYILTARPSLNIDNSDFFLEDDPQDYLEEKWSQKYKRSINCNNPKGFSQRAHCAGRKKK